MRLHKLFDDDLAVLRDPLSSPLSRSRAGALLLILAPWFGGLAAIVAPGEASPGADRAILVLCALSILTGAFMLRFPNRFPFVLAPVFGAVVIAVYSYLARGPVPLSTSATFATVAVLSALFFAPKHATFLCIWIYACLSVSEIVRSDLRNGLASAVLTTGWGVTATVVISALRVTVGQLVERLNHQSRTDALTGVANRLAFAEQGDAALERATASSCVGLLIVDLDRFKEINDVLGHRYGDLLLTAVANRLATEVGRRGMVARLGGDEFAVLLPDLRSRRSATEFAAHLVRSLDAQFMLDGTPVTIGASIGVAVGPDDGRRTTALLQAADLAMYQAKKRRSGYQDSVSATSTAPENIVLIGELRDAIIDRQLQLHYQPKIDLRTGEVRACEALVRWLHPVHGFIPPTSFIPIAEQTGLIHQLTHWVLREAIQQCAHWRADGRMLGVSVNVSARDLLDRTFVTTVRETLRDCGVPSTALCLEVTETSIMADPERASAVLREFRATGVQISIDDFGTGYSSLAYLRTIPANELKIDRTFITTLRAGDLDSAIVASTLHLAHRLGMSVVAEGVENAATSETLHTIGCDQAQGFFFARPMPADDVSRWLDERPQPDRLVARQPIATLA